MSKDEIVLSLFEEKGHRTARIYNCSALGRRGQTVALARRRATLPGSGGKQFEQHPP